MTDQLDSNPHGVGVHLPVLLDRIAFLAAGLGLFAIKYCIDFSVARVFYSRTWSPWEYLTTSIPLSSLQNLTEDAAFHLALLGIAVPFVVVGVMLTRARLRAAGLPAWLVVMFFLPVINLLFFAFLAVIPSLAKVIHAEQNAEPVQNPKPHSTNLLGYGHGVAAEPRGRKWWPESTAGSFWLAAFLPVPFGLAWTYLAVAAFREYGLGVFIALPFVAGLASAVLHALRAPRTKGQSMGVATVCGLLTALATVFLAVEGLGCVIMFLPLAVPIVLVGATVGHGIQTGARRTRRLGAGKPLLSLAITIVPAFMSAERVARPAAPVYAVTTSIEIDAPPETVWRNVVSFGRIAQPPNEWIFRMGVAHPLEATIDGQGVGAVRRCVFSTGAFVEPITIWDEPRLLKFDVSSNPPAMREWSPYDIHPPHVNDFLVSHGGQFHLIPLDGGRRTRIEGTTWYEHNLWPAGYWRLWSDAIIHRIHGRVLTHVKSLSEASS